MIWIFEWFLKANDKDGVADGKESFVVLFYFFYSL